MLLGQARAVKALRTGLELYAPGFNVFLSGLLGSGRVRIVRALLEEMKPACRLGPDRVFVHDFREPNKPRLLNLPRGQAEPFRADMLELGRAIRDTLQQSLRSRWHRASRRLVLQGAEERREKLFQALEREAQKQGCTLVQYRDGAELSADILPVHDREAISLDRLDELGRSGAIEPEEHQALRRSREELIERLEQATERTRRIYRETGRELQRVDRRMAERSLGAVFEEVEQRWQNEAVSEHLTALRDHVLESYADWLDDGEHEEEQHRDEGGGDHLAEPGAGSPHHRPELQVHIVKSDQGRDCPVVVETHPTYPNLFGTIEPSSEVSAMERVHPGALLRADGGYLILRAADLISEPGAWRHLQRALKTSTLEVREFDPSTGTTAGALQPEAIPIDVKVVLIGEPGLYEHLCHQEPEFMQLFKVHAEFDSTVANSVANRRRYADFLGWVSSNEELGTFAPQAIAAVVEFGARLAGRRTRLSTCFGELADLAREAAYLSRRRNGAAVEREHVESALEARVARGDLLREQTAREFDDGYVLLRTSGSKVGCVNALTVVESHSLAFGKPVRVTATAARASAERSELVSIEREAELSGPLHDKGVLTLAGFLGDRFGRDAAIHWRVTVCFEQLYSGLDGDSASCAELLAVLSSISGLPIQQGIAITGSLNQLGEVQPIGGVNEKIEGFFRLCKAQRMTGRQGVIVPRQNVEDLMLETALVDSVSRGRFHVHAVETIDEAVDVLFGRPASEVYDAVRAKLDES